ncbi:MAG TPA: hypothetical protein VGK67_06720 [Myxococcales bacterium]
MRRPHLCGLAILLVSSAAWAEPAPEVQAAPSAEGALAAVRAGVTSLKLKKSGDRKLPAYGNVLWGSAVIALGSQGLVYASPRGETALALVSGIGLALGATDLAQGLFELGADSSAERVADYLLADDERLRQSGFLFLYEHAEEQRRERLGLGVVQLVSGIAKGLALIPFLRDPDDGINPAVIAVVGVWAVVDLARAFKHLLSRSTEEKIYDSALEGVRATTAPAKDPGPTSWRAAPALFVSPKGAILPGGQVGFCW